MQYTEEQLDQLEKFASIYLKISDMAVILDIPPESLRWDISQKDTEVSQLYYRQKTILRGIGVFISNQATCELMQWCTDGVLIAHIFDRDCIVHSITG